MTGSAGSPAEEFDVVLIGAGIMSTTLGALLNELEPTWSIALLEGLGEAGLESSHPWNNAGTGHAGLCEFNYTPRRPDGSVDPGSAISINEQFQASLQYWAHLVETGHLTEPASFIRTVPHFGFARGADGVDYLRARHRALSGHPLFDGTVYSDVPEQLAQWLPLMFADRQSGPAVAVTRNAGGTDVNYGAIAARLATALSESGCLVGYRHRVTNLRQAGQHWMLDVETPSGHRRLRAKHVFVGAGGGTLPLLQKAGIPEIRGYAGFPISGRFLRTDNPALVSRHRAKVYGHAASGTPSVSVPHLDLRIVGGREYLLFGPFAAFSPRFLKTGALSDLPRSVTPGNLGTLLSAAGTNASLVSYLVRQILQSVDGRLAALREFVPQADGADWELLTAGQRVQTVKRVGGHGSITGFGTEVVVSAGGTLAGLLGASPGASASVSILLEVLRACFPTRFEGWQRTLRGLMPALDGQRAPSGFRSSDSERARRILGLDVTAGR
ncbi:malate dehydrogenase (quinone) [Arthrobacter sp. CAU 1506]|uniref:malate dehydrogenase (quinone) n=1 Tax=Arthrobacter sp. CAU 1506 TaxID=2560052 RepID=UPI0010AD4FE2|nr:malate dehydrogenase (quinone) [Arthrobacter sp. CAU 1506]TJY69149.1 malate dehydrogenase (quinone) [Arthrobacter sp. CAU 1506]